MKIFICANLYKEKTSELFPDVIRTLKKYGMTPLVESRFTDKCREMNFLHGIEFDSAEVNSNECDVFLTIGGDGTILRWGKKAALFNKPLLGINTGRLGFMAMLEKNNLSKLSTLAEGNYQKSRRMMLDVVLTADGKRRTYNALNDVVLFKGTRSKLPEYLVFSGDTEVTRIRADGLIISTPTGSTAYSLSAGGPIIDPQIACFELTALSAHTLFNRPMLLSVEKPLRAEYIAYENSNVFVSVDGNEAVEMLPDDSVSIKKSDLYLDLIDIDGVSFFNAVHNKLMQPLK